MAKTLKSKMYLEFSLTRVTTFPLECMTGQETFAPTSMSMRAGSALIL